MSVDQIVYFLLEFAPGIVVWGISYLILIRSFHPAVSVVEIIAYTGICNFLNTLTKDIHGDSNWFIWVVSVILGMCTTLLIKYDVILRFFRWIRLTQKTMEPDVFRILAADSSRNCYVHLTDGTVILGNIRLYSDNARGFYLVDARYIMIKEKLVDKDWYRPWYFEYDPEGYIPFEGIYFDDFSNIRFIEFEQPPKK